MTTCYITFGDCFNKYVRCLPKEIREFTFEHNFNQCINNLPKSTMDTLHTIKLFQQCTYF